ncbi:MAG: AarF/ABC1/UbiB kinase family protein [Deltaproteobacteria bacterium]|nr:AarF/ABC1/UbiB kinase family protein [Deltaproteobacteria bacterium]
MRYLLFYRVLRVTGTLAWVLPRYLVLIARERSPRLAASQAAWDRTHAIAARQIRLLALALEGAFTKAAQIGGARADVLPEPFIDELSQFHDAVPPRSFESLRGILERDLGQDLDSAFQSVQPEALAAASLAQVHRATLRDGRKVVIKIQYPEIRRIIPLDLAMLRRVAGLIHAIQRRVDLRSVVTEVTRFIELELDFEREVRSTERLAAILEPNTDVCVPWIERDLCGENIIVMEYLDGIQVTRIADLEAAGHKPAEVARKIGGLYGAMIFEHGFFHGDPHPGNLLVLSDGRIGLLDFGLCKQLPRGFSRDIAQMMVCAMIGDTDAAVQAADHLGFETDEIRPEHLRSLMLSVIGDSDGEESVFDILGQSRIRRIPEDFALVIRTLILLNGLSHRLAPRRRLIQAELIQHLAAGVAKG